MTVASNLARELVNELAHCGVRHVVLCPGSRSAPLAYAIYDAGPRHGFELHVRHDERVAAFTALGIGRVLGVPAAVVTTSGTAVANLHPAVLEAHHAGVPLLVLTADRPARLRGTWANQTSDLQAGIFGAATRFTADLTQEQDQDAWAAATRAAISAARGSGPRRPGPVHLNLGFDEPLVPVPGDTWTPAFVADQRTSEHAAPSTESASVLVDGTLRQRTVVVAGDGAGRDARDYAEAWGLPLLAEPTSGSRGGPNLVAPYRLLLDRPELGGRIERVVAFGRPTLSRPVTALLARPEVELVLVQRHPDDLAPDRTDVQWATVSQVMLARAAAYDEGPAAPSWLAQWSRAGALAAQALDRVLDGWPVLTGPLVAREVAVATQAGDFLMLAASNAIRNVDLAGPGWAGRPRVFANRGLSGIDGTVSTAIGLCLAGRSSARVLVGDIAFLHDLGALVLGPGEQRPDLTVVVVNDGGGGIFSLLEPGADAERDVAAAERFERVFGTPQDVDLGAVCAGLGVPHQVVHSTAGLRERLSGPSEGLSVVEVPVDREDLRPLQEAIARAVGQALDAPS
jgi:2-succinyl-5-enolpyruvyl-6-hydroxy-3-cyclohexene-1-carboxylate synthase